MLSFTKETLFELDHELKEEWINQETEFEKNIKQLINDANKLVLSNPINYAVNINYTLNTENISGHYSGPLNKGLPHGRGIFVFKSNEVKNTYIGDFVNGIPEGYGCTEYTEYTMRGQIKRGKYQGLVSVKFANKDSYYGKMEQGIFHGMGRYIFNDGTKLSGLFLNQEFHSGTAVYADGIVCKGYFENVILVSGTKVYPDNSIEQGIFKNGLLHYGSKTTYIEEEPSILNNQLKTTKKKLIQTGVFHNEILIADKHQVVSLNTFRQLTPSKEEHGSLPQNLHTN